MQPDKIERPLRRRAIKPDGRGVEAGWQPPSALSRRKPPIYTHAESSYGLSKGPPRMREIFRDIMENVRDGKWRHPVLRPRHPRLPPPRGKYSLLSGIIGRFGPPGSSFHRGPQDRSSGDESQRVASPSKSIPQEWPSPRIKPTKKDSQGSWLCTSIRSKLITVG